MTATLALRPVFAGLVLAIAVPSVMAVRGSACLACCPEIDRDTVSLSTPDCCGNDCAPSMRDSGARSCAIAQRASAVGPLIAAAPALTASPVLASSPSPFVPFLAPSPPGPPVITALRL